MQDNAIAREIAKLDEQWEDFIALQKPMLRWSFHPEDLPLARGFIRFKEQLDEASPELYVELHSDFTQPDRFGYELADEFNHTIATQIAAAFESPRDAPDTNDVLTRWRTPSLDNCQNGLAAFIRSLVHTWTVFEDYVHYLVVFVSPNHVKDPSAFAGWWNECCGISQDYEWPKFIKLVVFDNAADSPLAAIAQANPASMDTAKAPVNLRRALDAILDETDDGSPAAAFRKHNLHLQQAVADRDQEKMNRAAHAALEVAKAQHWRDLAIAVLLTRAAGLIALNQHPLALADYRLAQTWASAALDEVPGLDKLRVQAAIGEATCLFSSNHFVEASRAYQQAAHWAESIPDQFSQLESLRMASYCLEREGHADAAWELGLKALAIGDAMDEPTRAHSTLPFLGQALLRLSPGRDLDEKIYARFDQLLGSDWQKKMENSYAGE